MRCQWCDQEIKDKDVIGLNRKLIAVDTTAFYCLECMADYFGCDTDALRDKIQSFKEEGCTLFS